MKATGFPLALALAAGLLAQNTNWITVIPAANDSAVGTIKFAEKRANGSNTIGFRAPDAISYDLMYTWPGLPPMGANDAPQCLAARRSDGLMSWIDCSIGATTNPTFDNVKANYVLITNRFDPTLWYALYYDDPSNGALLLKDKGGRIIDKWDAQVNKRYTMMDQLPSADNTYDLGGVNNRFKTLYVNNLNLGSAVNLVTSVAPPLTVAAGVASCPTCVTTTGGQTITGVITMDNDFIGHGVVRGRQLEIHDQTGSPGNWFMRAWASVGQSYLNIYNEVTQPVLTLNYMSQGVANPSAEIWGNVIPDVNDTRDLGVSNNRWRTLYVGDIVATRGGSYVNAGTSPLVVQNSTVSCPTCFTTAGGTINGVLTMGNDIRSPGIIHARQFEFADQTGSPGNWFVRAYASVGQSYLNFYNEVSQPIVTMNYMSQGVANPSLEVWGNMIPDVSGLRHLGVSTNQWNDIWVQNMNFATGAVRRISANEGASWHDGDLILRAGSNVTFNDYGNIITINSTGGGASTVTVSPPIVSSGGQAPNISCPTCITQAGGVINGVLTMQNDLLSPSGIIRARQFEFHDQGGSAGNWFARAYASAGQSYLNWYNEVSQPMVTFNYMVLGQANPSLEVWGNLIPDQVGRSVGVSTLPWSYGYIGSLNSGDIQATQNLYVTQGNTYIRTFLGQPSCSGVNNGWIGIDISGGRFWTCAGGHSYYIQFALGS